jgi:phosphonate degradation associated HDIG domain protein
MVMSKVREQGPFMSELSRPHHPTTEAILGLFRAKGGSRYGGEAVSQLEHALQAASFAEAEGASASLIAAALLHDIGHLLHRLPENAPDQGIDDRHEKLGSEWLQHHFGPEVYVPVNLHVAAKRYLCAAEPEYQHRLSGPSIQSLILQGGPMSEQEVVAFESERYFRDAVRLRRFDDAAKVVGLATPDLEHFARCVDEVASHLF